MGDNIKPLVNEFKKLDGNELQNSNNSILPNEDSLDMKGYGSKDMKIIKINFSFIDIETLLKCDIEYELDTNLITWSKWY